MTTDMGSDVGAAAPGGAEAVTTDPVLATAGGLPVANPMADVASPSGAGFARPLDLLHGVEMAVTVELGRTRVLMRDLLGLRAGSIVELDRPAGGPVDVVVNGTLLARGEVVVVDDELGVRITEVVGTNEDS